MKLVLNRCYGGFGLSSLACDELGLDDKPGTTAAITLSNGKVITYKRVAGGTRYSSPDASIRSSPELVSVVEKLGHLASGDLSRLEIVEVPDWAKFRIEDNDGYEIVEFISGPEVCPYCGSVLDTASSTCSRCGAGILR